VAEGVAIYRNTLSLPSPTSGRGIKTFGRLRKAEQLSQLQELLSPIFWREVGREGALELSIRCEAGNAAAERMAT
jgi:hypothetical protein